MRIESLRYFLGIAQTGSFSSAARRLYVSQQGLSKAIQALEKELGVALFERTGKRIRLTQAGRDLVPLARTCVEDYETLEAAMRAHAEASRIQGTVRLEAMPFVANGLFTLMRNVLAAHDLRNVVLVEKSLPEILSRIADPSRTCATAAMVVVPDTVLASVKKNPRTTYVPLIRSNIVIAGTKALLSPRKRAYSIKEVAQLPIAYYNEPVLDDILAGMFAEHPLENTIMHASNLQMINEYVGNGQAVTFSDTFSAYLSNDAGEVLFAPIENAAAFTVGFAHGPAADIENATLSYIERFESCIAETYGAYLAKHPLTDTANRTEP